MKSIKIFSTLFIFIIIFTIQSCKKNKNENNSALPLLSTIMVSNISYTSANSGGNIYNGGANSVTARGVCWSLNHNPDITTNKTLDGSGSGLFTSQITPLMPGKIFYVRAYATNSYGTNYGNEVSFLTPNYTDTISDIDGNIYHIILIGNQTWTVENLRTTRYRNGDPIPYTLDAQQWSNSTADAYCYYEGDIGTGQTYGYLYNELAVIDSRGLAPAGWHISSDSDWTVLTNYLGGQLKAGSKLKESGTLHWSTPNSFATNESGFTALPAGSRDMYGTFNDLGNSARWWTSTAISSDYFARRIVVNDSAIYKYQSFYTNGFSVRCVKD